VKRNIYILGFALSILGVSCQKQDVVPVSNSVSETHEWTDSAKGINTTENDTTVEVDSHGNPIPTEGSTGPTVVEGEGGGITDPNNDPDGSKKGKGIR